MGKNFDNNSCVVVTMCEFSKFEGKIDQGRIKILGSFSKLKSYSNAIFETGAQYLSCEDTLIGAWVVPPMFLTQEGTGGGAAKNYFILQQASLENPIRVLSWDSEKLEFELEAEA